MRELGIGFDAVDERRTPWRGGEQPFENDQLGLMLEDGLKSLNRLCIGKGKDFILIRQLLLQGRHEVGSSNHDRGHGKKSITRPFVARPWHASSICLAAGTFTPARATAPLQRCCPTPLEVRP